jgi:hypothetical protein
MSRISIARMPKLHQRMTLNRLFMGWSTPLREVANGEIVEAAPVDVEFADSADVVALARSSATSSREASFSLSGAMTSVYSRPWVSYRGTREGQDTMSI